MFVYLNLQALPQPHTIQWNTWWPIENLESDTGGPTYYYLKKHPEIRTHRINEFPILEKPEHFHWSIREKNHYTKAQAPESLLPSLVPLLEHCGDNDIVQFFHDFAILHFHCGSNIWIQLPQEFRRKKWEHVKELIEHQIKLYQEVFICKTL